MACAVTSCYLSVQLHQTTRRRNKGLKAIKDGDQRASSEAHHAVVVEAMQRALTLPAPRKYESVDSILKPMLTLDDCDS
jgi:hypothetical protein